MGAGGEEEERRAETEARSWEERAREEKPLRVRVERMKREGHEGRECEERKRGDKGMKKEV